MKLEELKTIEQPMVRFAEENGYQRIDDLGLTDRYGDGILYLRPALGETLSP